MSNPYVMFGTNEDFEVDGVWLDYNFFRIKLARAGGRNTLYTKTLTKEHSKYKNTDLQVLGEEVSREIMIKVFAKGVIRDWNVKDENDQWVRGIHLRNSDGDVEIAPVNIENIKQVLRDLPDLMSKLLDESTKRANYQVEVEEEILGN